MSTTSVSQMDSRRPSPTTRLSTDTSRWQTASATAEPQQEQTKARGQAGHRRGGRPSQHISLRELHDLRGFAEEEPDGCFLGRLECQEIRASQLPYHGLSSGASAPRPPGSRWSPRPNVPCNRLPARQSARWARCHEVILNG